MDLLVNFLTVLIFCSMLAALLVTGTLLVGLWLALVMQVDKQITIIKGRAKHK